MQLDLAYKGLQLWKQPRVLSVPISVFAQLTPCGEAAAQLAAAGQAALVEEQARTVELRRIAHA